MPKDRDLCNENGSHRCDLQLNSYPQGFTGSVINSKGCICPSTDVKLLISVNIPCAKGVSEKITCIGNDYSIRMFFRTKRTLRSSLMRTRPESDPQQSAQCL
jgi:hypothetical protein